MNMLLYIECGSALAVLLGIAIYVMGEEGLPGKFLHYDARPAFAVLLIVLAPITITYAVLFAVCHLGLSVWALIVSFRVLFRGIFPRKPTLPKAQVRK